MNLYHQSSESVFKHVQYKYAIYNHIYRLLHVHGNFYIVHPTVAQDHCISAQKPPGSRADICQAQELIYSD